MYQLEVIAFTISSCITAELAGAQRIELCDNPGEGGTTPSFGMIRRAREVSGLQLYPIIRPRGGDFCYSTDEFRIMQQDVMLCRDCGCDGVVAGILLPDGTVDRERMTRLAETAYPLGVTFHRAFDRVKDMNQSLEDVISSGCERILTSGLRPGVTEGADNLKALVERAGDRIIIMPGSGLRAGNIAQIARHTGAREFHSSARRMIAGRMTYQNPLMNENLQQADLDDEEVRRMVSILSQLQQENSMQEDLQE